jgi:cytochrome c556
MTSKIVFLTMSMMACAGLARGAEPDPILLRQAIMDLQGGALAGITAVANAKGDVKKTELAARGLQRSGSMIVALFPKGTETGQNTKAKAEIWSDPAGFKKAVDTFDEAATKLVDATRTGNPETVLASVKTVEDACVSCHRSYRNR